MSVFLKTDNPFALVNGKVILPDRIVPGMAVVIEGSKILGLEPEGSLSESIEAIDLAGRFISPGFIDIHTHGALGHTFNEPDAEAFQAIVQQNAKHGVTSLLATIATAPLPDMVSCLKFAKEWMAAPHPGAQVLGIHLEGPYFSQAQRGAQDPANMRNPKDDAHLGFLDRLLEHHVAIRLMSYAPELPGAIDLTRRLAQLGIVPAAGHSSATDEDLRAVVQAGLTHVIHLWSGQSTTVREGPWRKPGLLEATLVSSDLTAEIIADNKHLPPTLMRLAYQCLGAQRLCLVSDATSGAGLPEGSFFRMGEMHYEVHDGVGMVPDHTAFAGSTTLLGQMISLIVQAAGIPLVDAVRMASLTPARVAGVQDRKGSLEAGKDADITILENDLSIYKVIIGGNIYHVHA
ncbi:MAG: N-acetylglucosamine-6-phosphate deacetylase [Omnitrophica WOR_2 bacterium]